MDQIKPGTKVHRFNLPYTDLCIYEQEDLSHRATLNGVLLPEIFAKDIDVEDVKACCLQILFSKYAYVLKLIEKSVIGDKDAKGKCENDLCKGHKQDAIEVPVQSEEGHGHETDKRDGKS
ncbi:MAG TPA: hypothetical protein PLE74_01060 [Candidatus Cloacimonadota bacterium]|nr:hypothetical protein [Candidatus Cloacimonadota bacterium]